MSTANGPLTVSGAITNGSLRANSATADESAINESATYESTPAIGLDLGRHRAYCALADPHADTGVRLIPLSEGDPGRWLRWRDNGSERVTDRVLRLAGANQGAAETTIAAVAEDLFPELADGAELSAAPTVVVPAAFGPECRRAVRRGMAMAGAPTAALVARPVATFSHWLALHPEAEMLDGVVLVIDNDLGQLSILAADMTDRRLLLVRPLSLSADDDPAEVLQRLGDAITDVHRLTDTEWDGTPTTAWQGRSTTGVVLTGSAVDHPTMRALVQRGIGDVPVEFGGDQSAAALGAAVLGTLSGWSCCWPTLTLCIDGLEMNEPGPMPTGDLAARPHSRQLSVRKNGIAVPFGNGSVVGLALALPPDLGEDCVIRVLDDGRVIVLGEEGRRPLSFRVRWPAPGTARADRPVPIEVVGRRPLVFPEPIVMSRAVVHPGQEPIAGP